MIRISVDDLIALQRYTIYNNERLNYDVFWFNYGRKAQKNDMFDIFIADEYCDNGGKADRSDFCDFCHFLCLFLLRKSKKKLK